VNKGPYLAGINAGACAAQGGTWCPAPTNCADLQVCVQEHFEVANVTEGQEAFAWYLAKAPEIEDPTDFRQCGEARQYFGFDEYFIHDVQICADLGQLRFSKDFDFLNEFFGQGEAVPEGGGILELVPPDRGKSVHLPQHLCGHRFHIAAKFTLVLPFSFPTAVSESKPVQKGAKWRKHIMIMGVFINGFTIASNIVSVFGDVSQRAKVIYLVLRTILGILELVRR
jgi:hypothetical protein